MACWTRCVTCFRQGQEFIFACVSSTTSDSGGDDGSASVSIVDRDGLFATPIHHFEHSFLNYGLVVGFFPPPREWTIKEVKEFFRSDDSSNNPLSLTSPDNGNVLLETGISVLLSAGETGAGAVITAAGVTNPLLGGVVAVVFILVDVLIQSALEPEEDPLVKIGNEILQIAQTMIFDGISKNAIETLANGMNSRRNWFHGTTLS